MNLSLMSITNGQKLEERLYLEKLSLDTVQESGYGGYNMLALLGSVLTALITGGLTLLGVIYTNKKQHSTTVQEVKTEIALIRQEINQLEKKQDIHNGVIERVYQLEKITEVLDERQKTANHRIDDLEKGD